jgi:hypothetical protein
MRFIWNLGNMNAFNVGLIDPYSKPSGASQLGLRGKFRPDTRSRRFQGVKYASIQRFGRGPASKLQQHLERISALTKPRQRAVMDVIEAMLAQPSR